MLNALATPCLSSDVRWCQSRGHHTSMKDFRARFGIPDTLPPLTYRELRSCFWFGGIGLLLILLGLFHNAVLLRVGVVGWLALPFLGLLRRRTGESQKSKRPAGAQVWIYTLLVVGFGVGFTFWARHLGLGWPVVIGSLFLIEGLAGAIASLTEWWRLSLMGHAIGLMICGVGIPFVDKTRAGVLVGAAVLFGSLLSAGILYWQLQQYKAPPDNSLQPTATAPSVSTEI